MAWEIQPIIIEGWVMGKIRLIPFIYSSEVAYEVELGNEYMRFFYDGSVLLDDDDNEVWIETPYLTADLPQLQYKQVGDVMWITHPSYKQRKLTRTSATTFSLDVIPFKKGPFFLRNDLIDPDVTDAALMVCSENDVGDIGTLTCESSDEYLLTLDSAPGGTWSVGETLTGQSSGATCVIVHVTSTTVYVVTEPSGDFTEGEIISNGTTTRNCGDGYPIVINNPINFFQAGRVGALFQLTHPKGTLNINGHFASTETGYVDSEIGTELIGKYTFTISSNVKIFGYYIFVGVVKLQKSNNGFVTSTDVKTYTNKGGKYKATELEEDWYYRINVTTHTGGTIIARLTADTNTVSGKLKTTATGVIGYPIYLKGTYTFNTHGNWDATVVLERNENGAGWEPYRTYISKIVNGAGTRNVQYAGVESAANVQFRINVVIHTSGTIYADLTSSENIASGIVEVTTINSASEAAIVVISKLVSTEATRRWAEGAWSEIQNYPTSVGFFEGRCVFGGMSRIPIQITSDYDIDANNYSPKLLKVWLSHSDDYENFEAGLNSADSFEVVISTADDIMWFEALEALVLGTSGDEWRIGSNRMEQLLTPTNYTVRQQSTYGGRNIQAIRANDKILFVDSVGRKVQELAYNGDKYVALDLTSLAEHITLSGIVWTAYQKNPDSILWCGLDNGNLIGMVYNREQNIYDKFQVAWFPCPIDGDVYSGCVTPGADEDNVTLAIQRTINDVEKIYIEKFALRNFGTLIEDAFFVDCGITYEGAATSTITGLDHLEGETVKVLGNGVVFDDAVVSSGQITTKLAGVTTTVTKAQVGLAYTSKLMPMKPVVNTQMGSSAASIVSCKEMGISFLNTMGAKYGTSDDNLMDINFDDPRWENSSEISDLFTGTVAVSVDGGFSIDNNLIISSDSPLPCTVRALIPKVEVTGR